jgi:alkylation response protein AidB-like acyl-CoA dehydrogenase
MDFALDDEQQMFFDTIRSWVDREFPKEVALELERREHEFPQQMWDKMAEAGFHGLSLPEEYGGQGADIVTQMLLARGLARNLSGLTWIWGTSSFCAKTVAEFASDEARSEVLPRLASGEVRLGIGVTEPAGGTDVLGAMRTRARRVDGGWAVTGQKIWTTMADTADYLVLLARTSDEDKPSRGLTSFLLPTGGDSYEARPIDKVGLRCMSSCEVFLEDHFVPDHLVIGEVGRGWYQMLTSLNNERIMLAALCTGIIDGCLEEASRYLLDREAFGKPIGSYQAMQHHLAEMAMGQAKAELFAYRAAWMQQQGLPCGLEANMAKVVASEEAFKAADTFFQILGGMGYSAETQAQRYWRDVRIFRIAPITNEMARLQIAMSLGMPRSF